MERKIIEQMIKIAGSERAGDLSYDMMALANYNGEFVWSVYGKSYTGFQKCSKELILRDLNTERGKYNYANNGFCFMFQTWGEPRFFIYKAGGSLQLDEASEQEAREFCKKQYEDALAEWRADGNEFPEQTEIGDLQYNCMKEIQKQLKYANEHNDNSLRDILSRLMHRPRVADDHYIVIGKDFTDRSFTFTEFINGTAEMRGGIIFHGYPDEGYKENYSVQLSKSYGWQMHT